MVQFDIFREVMVGLYWSFGKEEGEEGGDVIGGFCRALPQHLH